MGVDPVPEADREEQELPPTADPRAGHPHPVDRPEADVLEQEVPVADVGPSPGIDAERTEADDDPLDERRDPDAHAEDADWLEERTEP